MAVAVRFTRPVMAGARYNDGDIAGFSEQEAQRIIDAGWGVRHEVPTEAKPVVTAAATKVK